MRNLVPRELLLSLIAFVLAVSAAPVAAEASVWCGDNGTVRFSFVEGDSLVDVWQAADAENGVTSVTVYAWLTDVEPVARDGVRFMRIGGVEMSLSITGAEAFILKEEFPSQVLNVGRKMGEVAAGLIPGTRLTDGRALLVKWEVMFQGRPENVRFGLNRESIQTCNDIDGCPEAEPQMIYVGAMASDKMGGVFGAGYVPAWLNPTGTPDQTPVHGKQHYTEVGVYTAD